jgi:4-hydroxybenzoate polyprenyltransferase
MSATELVAAYLRERMRVRVLVPLSLLLASAGWCLAPSAGFQAQSLFVAGAQAFLLVLGFRVWDDYEDRNVDLVHHPERVMVTSERLWPFAVLVVVLGVASTVWVLQLSEPFLRITALAIATGTLSGWYASRRSENWNRVLGGLIVLLKYPFIAFAVAPSLPDPASGRTIVVLGGLYLLICVYEYVDDAELRRIISSRGSLP